MDTGAGRGHDVGLAAPAPHRLDRDVEVSRDLDLAQVAAASDPHDVTLELLGTAWAQRHPPAGPRPAEEVWTEPAAGPSSRGRPGRGNSCRGRGWATLEPGGCLRRHLYFHPGEDPASTRHGSRAGRHSGTNADLVAAGRREGVLGPLETGISRSVRARGCTGRAVIPGLPDVLRASTERRPARNVWRYSADPAQRPIAARASFISSSKCSGSVGDGPTSKWA